jgi:hypothetical protein
MSTEATPQCASTAFIGPMATVDETCTLSDSSRASNRAKVLEHSALSGNAVIGEEAILSVNSTMTQHAQVAGSAVVTDRSYLEGTALVSGWAQVKTAALYGNAVVTGHARVHSDAEHVRVGSGATIQGTADIGHTRHYFVIGPVGSENRYVSVFRAFNPSFPDRWGALVTAGCFLGTPQRLASRMDHDHAWGEDFYARRKSLWEFEYRTIVELAMARLAEWRAQGAPDAGDIAFWDEQLERGAARYNITALLRDAMHRDGDTQW